MKIGEWFNSPFSNGFKKRVKRNDPLITNTAIKLNAACG
jgi:hypothetical protein